MKKIILAVSLALPTTAAFAQSPRLDCLVNETIVLKEGAQPRHIAPNGQESFTFHKINAGQLRVTHQMVRPNVYTINITKNIGTKLGMVGADWMANPTNIGIDLSTSPPTFAVQTFAPSTGATVLTGGSCSWFGGNKW